MRRPPPARLTRRPLLKGALAAGVVAGLPAAAQSPAAPSPAAPSPATPATEALPSWQQVLDGARRRAGLVGVSASVVRSHAVLFVGGSGQADLVTHRPMTADTVLYAGSLSKIFTAVLALRLRDDKRLTLGAPLRALRDKGHPTFTTEHLLTHTAGLERESPFSYWFTADFPDDKALRAAMATAPLRSTPGTRWHYSNVGYALLGQVLGEAAGTSYADALKAKVLSPLSLDTSGADGEPPLVTLAMGYTPRGTLLPSPAQPFAGVGEQVGERHERLYHRAKAMTPAFGVYSSARDLGKLGQTLLGHADDTRVLSARSRQALFAPKVAVNRSGTKFWSLGLKLLRRQGQVIARHEGWFAAHRSHLLIDPQLKVAVAVMANSDDAAPAQLADVLMAHARRVLDADVR
jgi:CubicO group peptidase (beta-lactamase class C family)